MRPGWLALALVACTPGGAVGPGYRGEPLFTVKGQLVTPGAVPSTPIRLAIAWYPDESSSTAPRAIVTQEVVYEGRFPLNYSFGFFTLPPPGVLVEYRDGDEVTKAAFGVLLAYEDVDGDGQLDPIAAGGRAIDRVLGTSVGDTYNGAPADEPLWVAYVDGTPGRRWAGYTPGYNLWNARLRAVVPPDTEVPIRLDATNELAFFVCDEFISGSSYGFDLPCNVEPTGGVRVIGNVYTANGVGIASLRITDGRAPLSGLVVEVNDAGIPYDAERGSYFSTGAVPVVTPGRNVVTVRAPSQAPLVFTVEAPGLFSLQAPGEGARLLAGSTLPVQWSRSEGATFYQVRAGAVTRPNDGPPAVLVSEPQRSVQLSALVNDDTHEVAVSAFAPRYLAHGRGGSLVNTFALQFTSIDVLPVDSGAWLEGSVVVTKYQGQTGASAWLEAFDGVAAVASVALVTVNGEALPWDAQFRRYGGGVAVTPGAVVLLGVTVPGRARTTFEVTLPEDFTVTAPPPTHPVRAPLRLEWTSAVGATDYRVSVTDPSGRFLHFSNVQGTSATLPPLEVVGEVFVTVAAAKQAGRHRVGLVQESFDVTLVE